jgi:WXG100 family type VII secretion target
MPTRFAVDADLLVEVTTRMSACEVALEQLTSYVEARVAQLHGRWHGPAAETYVLAQAEWERGLAVMRSALEEIRAGGERARARYEESAADNELMWRQLR